MAGLFGSKGGPRPFRPALGGAGGKGPPEGKGLKGPLGAKGWVEEDRRSDWYCVSCRERNFMKRAQCFKCGSAKPKEGEGLAPPKPPPPTGSTLNGMVKSYNKKGFGFIMCLGDEDIQDIYYIRENVSPRLLHPDMPGEHVTFELIRGPDGRLTAKNIRPFGEDKNGAGTSAKGHVFGKAGAKGASGEEDRSLDWTCSSCKERNFVKRIECFRCRTPKASGFGDVPKGPPRRASPPPPRRTFSPHAGSRAVRDSLAAGLAARGRGGVHRSRSRSSGRRRGKRKRQSSSEKSSSSSRAKKKKKKNKSKKKRSSSSGSSSSENDCKMEEPSGAPVVQPGESPEIDEAKTAALKELVRLSTVEPKEARMTEWRALLRQWHPDKNPDRTEVATAVFQFLQKGKSVIDPS